LNSRLFASSILSTVAHNVSALSQHSLKISMPLRTGWNHAIDSVAMESTSVYWIPFFQLLESRGFKVFVVNAHHVKLNRPINLRHAPTWVGRTLTEAFLGPGTPLASSLMDLTTLGVRTIRMARFSSQCYAMRFPRSSFRRLLPTESALGQRWTAVMAVVLHRLGAIEALQEP
jgi:hypothetical protein